MKRFYTTFLLMLLGSPIHLLAQQQIAEPRIAEQRISEHRIAERRIAPTLEDRVVNGETPIAVTLPAAGGADRPLPINLPTALQLAGAKPLDIAIASERIRLASADLSRAHVLWLPTLYLGADYFRHDGQLQDVGGFIFGTSKSNFMVGGGASAVFAISDAIFAPLAARQVLKARESSLLAAQNDATLTVAEAYFSVQQARGELAGAMHATTRAEELLRRAEKLAAGLVAPVEAVRAQAELARRKQSIHLARERWRTASAELARVLRLDASALVEPIDPPHLQVTLVDTQQSVDDLIPIGLTNRPELAAHQALVRATLDRLKLEKFRPIVPSVLLRPVSTVPGGTLGAGAFGGGKNSRIADFSGRSDWDLQVVWELQNLGLGNKARVDERRAENQIAILELFRMQDRVAAEVVQAYAQAQESLARVRESESGLKVAQESVEKNFDGMNQTRRVGDVILLLVRPQEVVASVQALAQAYNDYYGSVADYDRAQFRLYRALGHPAQALCGGDCDNRRDR